MFESAKAVMEDTGIHIQKLDTAKYVLWSPRNKQYSALSMIAICLSLVYDSNVGLFVGHLGIIKTKKYHIIGLQIIR